MSLGVKNKEIKVMRTGSSRKPSRLAFAGAVWDAGLRLRGGIGLLRVSF